MSERCQHGFRRSDVCPKCLFSAKDALACQLAEALQDKAYVEDELKRRNHQWAEAQAENARRGEALEAILTYIDDMAARTSGQPKEMLPDKRIGMARVALAATPELTNG